MLDQLVDAVSGKWTAYPVIFLIVMGDAVVPVLPGETAIITGAILSTNGALSWPIVLIVGALGAFAGDNAAYWLGRLAGRRYTEKLFRTEKARARLDWAAAQIDERGATIIATARFVPGGRTATTFTAGTVGLAWTRFAVADIVGAVLWSGVATAMGLIGGQAFKNSLWKPVLFALAAGAVIALLGELLHRRLSRSRSRRVAADALLTRRSHQERRPSDSSRLSATAVGAIHHVDAIDDLRPAQREERVLARARAAGSP